MLANFLNKSKPINFIGLLIFFFICFATSVFSTLFVDGFTLDKLLKAAILLVLFLGVFFFYNFILSKNKLTFDNSYAYYIFTLLVISILPVLTNYKVLFLAIIHLLFLRKLYSLRSSKKVIQKLFDGGLWLGLFFIFEPYSFLYFVIIFAAIYLHQKITLHTLFTPIIGFITPLFLYFTYLFWYDKTADFTSLFSFNFNFDIQVFTQTKYAWYSLTLVFITIFSILFKSLETISVSNTFRRSWTLLILNFFILMLFLALLPEKDGSEIIFILFPISVIVGNGIELIKKKIVLNIFLFLMLFSAIFFCFYL